jgi:hypothetical protein
MRFVLLSHFLTERTEAESIANVRMIVVNGSYRRYYIVLSDLVIKFMNATNIFVGV